MTPFSLLVKPGSADCNLRCRYCFYLCKSGLYPATARHGMPPDVLDRMVRTYLATPQPQHAFGWQGGEPTLMGLDFFRRVTDLQKEYGRPGGSVSNGLQTNGTLLDDAWAAHLAEYRFLVGVSLDGPAGIHDVHRRTVDGRGSHEAVLRGLGALRRHGVEHNVLVLVNSANVGRPAEVYRYLRDMGLMYQQYIECVEFDGEGNLLPYSVRPDAWGEFLCGLFDAWIEADSRRVSVRLFDSIVHRLVTGESNVCVMGRDCRQYLLVEHNGDVYPCDFFVEPDLRLGNVMTHSWEDLLGSPVYAEFGRRKSEWSERCTACEFLSLCAGDCQKHRHRAGRDPRQVSWLCAGWQRFYRHALPRLEQLAADVRRELQAEQEARQRHERARELRTAVGRNDACPCGSGRKFKRCCGATVL